MTSGAENIVTLDLVLPEELVTSDADMLQHYGKPPDGCEADEQAFSIGGVPGMVRANDVLHRFTSFAAGAFLFVV